MPLNIVENDITKLKVDAIVNAANTDLHNGGGVCRAIFSAAGAAELEKVCRKFAPVKTGYAAITPAFNLPCKYIIHAVGPIYSDYSPKKSAELLYSAYAQSLALAKENGCESIAFPLISSGNYGYPKDRALNVATEAIKDFLANNDLDVYLAVLDKTALVVDEQLLNNINDYLVNSYVFESDFIQYSPRVCRCIKEPYRANIPIRAHKLKFELEKMVESIDESFSQSLLKLIDKKGKTDVEVYKKANIDRKLFSKIRTNDDYTPSKRTVLALAISLELNLNETKNLLEKAGYALSHSKEFDIIIEYFIVNGKYDIFEINEVLFSYDQPLLGM